MQCINSNESRYLANRFDVDVNYQTDAGDTPLHWATHHGNLRQVEELLKCGADLAVTNRNGDTPDSDKWCCKAVGIGQNRANKEAILSLFQKPPPLYEHSAFCKEACKHEEMKQHFGKVHKTLNIEE